MRTTDAHIEARQNQILDAAWVCFAEHGHRQATMQDIAAKAGLSTGTIYLYYESKDALVEAINERSLEMGRRIVEAARASSSGPLSSMRSIGAAMISVFSDPGFEAASRMSIEMWPQTIRNEQLAANTRREIGFWRQEVARLLREAQEAGEISPDADPDTIAILSICAWEGLRHYKLIDPSISEEILVSIVDPYLTAGAAERLPEEDEAKGVARPQGAPWVIPSAGDASETQEEAD
ncbi:MAG TPA: TetR/AcrR family transcriptional regulator [Dehalococcoidia bacterium]